MFNDMMELLSDIPLTLAAAWAVWFSAGALLAVWYRKAHAGLEAHAALEMQHAVASRTVARAKSGSRHTVSAELRAMAEPRSKPTPIVVGDPFGDLATLLDQPAAETSAPVFRTPGDAPILNSAGSPVLRNSDPEPKH